ncbi:MAG: hypothetical protein GY807_10540 [Gammaproteobacteria bacterium]|nr:hypothetical protein [Gammaproteobacteria bacterium]
MGFNVKFRTPYLHLPVKVEKTQIGIENEKNTFQPGAFRFFDWQSWAHIAGKIDWQGEHEANLKGKRLIFISGFSYRVHAVPSDIENLGIRLAEGVEGYTRVLWSRDIRRMRFDPIYWMLEPTNSSCKVVAIKDHKLMVMIVSLSEIGSGNMRLYDRAVRRLVEWVGTELVNLNPEKTLLKFLSIVRDWGPLNMNPLFHGLKEVLERLQIEDQERIIFDFYADNWGLRNNRQGRLLAVKTLEALATAKARRALHEILVLVKNQEVEPQERLLIRYAIRGITENLSKK